MISASKTTFSLNNIKILRLKVKKNLTNLLDHFNIFLNFFQNGLTLMAEMYPILSKYRILILWVYWHPIRLSTC